jgi:lipid-A-disaccharide synthase-like uncharacterized protein
MNASPRSLRFLGALLLVAVLAAAGTGLVRSAETVPPHTDAPAGEVTDGDTDLVPVDPEAEQHWLVGLLNPEQVCPACGTHFRTDRSLFWLAIGFVGQALFTSRFVVQWVASERRKQSYIPVIFWYLSIGGSLMLFAYAVSIRAWPIIFGQAFGIIVYGRNLALIARHRNLQKEAAGSNEQT